MSFVKSAGIKEGGRLCLPYISICQKKIINLSIVIPEGFLDMVL